MTETRRFSFTIGDDEFSSLVEWLESLPRGTRSPAIREALASYYGGQAEVADVLAAVQEVDRRVGLLETRLAMISRKVEDALLLLQQGLSVGAQRPSNDGSDPVSEREPERARQSLNAMRNKFTGGGRG
jgi:hypothetical protein